MKHKLITTALASTIALTSVVGLGSAAFADDHSGSTSGKAPTAEEIVARQAERAEKLEERLSALVEAGTITEAQKADILGFFESNAPEYDADATKEEREAAREEFKSALETFAEDNGIDVDLLKPHKGGGKDISPEERAAKQEEHLSSLVEAGTITQDQMDAIIQFRTDNKPTTKPGDLTQEERKAQREEMRTAFEEFASDNGINIEDIKPPVGAGGPGGLRGQGGPGGHGNPGGY